MGYQAIKKSMSVTDKIYKQMIKEKDQMIKTEKTKKLKNIKIKQRIFYKQVNRHINTNTLKYFEENKKNCRAL